MQVVLFFYLSEKSVLYESPDSTTSGQEQSEMSVDYTVVRNRKKLKLDKLSQLYMTAERHLGKTKQIFF